MRLEVSLLYDHMAKFESFFMRVLKGKKSYAIHKKLIFRRHETSKTYHDINDWILDNIQIGDNTNVLDAGCGVGQTLFDICRMYNVSGLGISLSEDEITMARVASRTYKLNNRCSFEVRSFNDPFDEKFDLIIAIESLKHTDDLHLTLTNLAASLKDNGQLIIVDDFIVNAAADDRLRKTFIDSWSLHNLYEARTFTEILGMTDGHIKEIVDFTECVRKKNKTILMLGIKTLSFIKSVVIVPLLRNICLIFTGGLILDYYYTAGFMEYKLIWYVKGGHRT